MVNVDEVLLPAPDDRPLSVLIVEDEMLIRLGLSEYLQECGFTVFDVSDAAQAIAMLREGAFTVDVVLTDVMMPGDMDGLALARWIREHRPGLPVLITTGDQAMAEAAKDLCEKNPILHKPHDLKLVVARLREAIDGAAQTGPQSSPQ